jgi:pimeloyl-ACP methyl ester carboxylesterase
MHRHFLNTQFAHLNALLDPLSSAAVPLIYGLARRGMLRRGAAEHQVELGGASLNYFQQEPARKQQELPQPNSSPTPILLLHGIADNALTWAMVMKPLARDYPVYAVDLPGYGRSLTPAGRGFATLAEMRDILVAFMREVIGRPALIAGNSMGGWLAVKIAWAAPELTRGIVLLDAGGAPLEGRASWEPFSELIGVPDLKTSRRIFRQMFGAGPLLYLGQRGLQNLFHRQVVREFVASLNATQAPEDELLRDHELRELPVPAGLIWGMSDTFLPRGSLEFFCDNLPDAPTMLLRGCGHLPQVERPLAVVRFIRRFAAGLQAARTAAGAPGVQARADKSQSTNTSTTRGSQ